MPPPPATTGSFRLQISKLLRKKTQTQKQTNKLPQYRETVKESVIPSPLRVLHSVYNELKLMKYL
jgi:hypothetical protein